MNRQTFFYELRKKLTGLPSADVEKTLEYYNEMINDRIEEGLSESEAVATFGPVDQIVPQVLAGASLPLLVKERLSSSRKLRPWEIVLLIICSPLLLAALILLLSFFLVIWALVIALYIIAFSFGLCGIASIVFSGINFVKRDFTQGLLWLGTGLLLIGLNILLLIVSGKVAAFFRRLCKKILQALKTRLARRRNPL